MATKERDIVKKSIEYIAKNGMADFSSKKVAEAVGCSETLIYKYFRTKDLLIERCINYIAEWHIQTFHERAEKYVAGCKTDLEIARAIIYGYIRMCVEFSEETVFYAKIRVSRYNTVLSDAMARIEEEHYETFVEAVENANAQLFLTEPEGRFIFETASSIVTALGIMVGKGEIKASEEVYDTFLSIVMDGMDSQF